MAVTTSVAQNYNAKRATVTYAGLAGGDTITPDMNVGDVHLIPFGAGNLTLANPLNPAQGYILTLRFTQDGTGGRTVTWGAAFKKNLTLSAGAGAIDEVKFFYDGTNWNQTGSTLNVT